MDQKIFDFISLCFPFSAGTSNEQAKEDGVLKRFVHSTYGDVAYAKQVIELNYELRNKNSHIFLDRDPFSPEAQKVFQVCDMIPLPDLTPKDNYRMIFYRLRDANDSKFDFLEVLKVFFMTADSRISLEKNISNGDVPVFDMKGYSLKHIAKTLRSFSALRTYMNFTQNALPVRLRQIHVINVSPFIDKCLSVVKPLMKKEVSENLKFHLPNSESILEYIPKEMLPQEYGGDGPSLDELKKNIVNQIESRRDYLTDPDYWKMNWSKSKQEICGNIDLKALSID